MSEGTEYKAYHLTPLLFLGSSAILAGSLVLLARRLYWPTVLNYPWPSPHPDDKMKKVLFAGSFNPPHLGHLEMLRYLARRYGQVVVVVGVNPNKRYLVSPTERVSIMRKMVTDEKIEGQVRVEVVSGYIWKFAMREKVSIMFRGIRSWEKDGSEERFLYFLNSIGPIILGPLKLPLPTYFLEGKPTFNHISSTLIRTMCRDGKKSGDKIDLTTLVPSSTASTIAVAYGRSD